MFGCIYTKQQAGYLIYLQANTQDIGVATEVFISPPLMVFISLFCSRAIIAFFNASFLTGLLFLFIVINFLWVKNSRLKLTALGFICQWVCAVGNK
jgi:hypothetical protein